MSLWKTVFDVELNTQHKLRIGALECWFTIKENEWHFEYFHNAYNESDSEKPIKFTQPKKRPSNPGEVLRFIQSTPIKTLRIKPRMPDRSIVTKPSSPISLPPSQSVTLYLSTPLWIGVYAENQETPLVELPSIKLSDTWFGPKPHIGELCYASNFSGRMNWSNLPKRESRIITPIVIENSSKETLKLEKISIPSAHLDVFISANGMLCTQTLRLKKGKDHKVSEVTMDKTLIPEFHGAELISKASESDHSSIFNKTLDMFFH